MIQSPNMQMPMQPIPQQGSGANAVAINIYNPQAYGSVPNAQAQVPYNVEQPIYQMPYMPMYPQANTVAPIQIPSAYQQFMPVNNVMNAPVMPQASAIEPQFVAPAPQAMPQSVMAPAVEQAPYNPNKGIS